MNRTLLALVAAALAILLPVQASAACQTIKPRTWTGTIQLANHANTAAQIFVLSGCALPDELNGSDTLVLDVASHRGLRGAAKWSTASPVLPDQVTGKFYTAACTGLPGTGWAQPQPNKSVSFTIPTGAKWLVVSPYTLTISKDIAVTVTSPGRKCR